MQTTLGHSKNCFKKVLAKLDQRVKKSRYQMNWYVNQAAEFGSLLTVIKNVRHLREFELLSKLERQVCLKNLLQ